MTITVKQARIYSIPNDYSVAANSDPWEITSNQSGSWSFQFQTTDDHLPDRRYIVPAGRTVVVTFMRAKVMKLGQLDTSQTFSVTATPMSGDNSIWTISLTADQAALVASGTVRFAIMNGATAVFTTQIAYFVKKLNNTAGQGC